MVFKRGKSEPPKNKAESLFVDSARFPMDKALEAAQAIDFGLDAYLSPLAAMQTPVVEQPVMAIDEPLPVVMAAEPIPVMSSVSTPAPLELVPHVPTEKELVFEQFLQELLSTSKKPALSLAAANETAEINLNSILESLAPKKAELQATPLLVDPDTAVVKPVALFNLHEVSIDAVETQEKLKAAEIHEGIEQKPPAKSPLHNVVSLPPASSRNPVPMVKKPVPLRLLNTPTQQAPLKVVPYRPAAATQKVVIGLTYQAKKSAPTSYPAYTKTATAAQQEEVPLIELEQFPHFEIEMSLIDLDLTSDLDLADEETLSAPPPIVLPTEEVEENAALDWDLATDTEPLLGYNDLDTTPPAETDSDLDVNIIASTLLSQEFTLMLVRHEDSYALIVDNGENAMVLKSFEMNPLSANPVFEVTEEAQVRDNKILYMVQAGDWQGIIALESDEPTLQVEMGLVD